MQMLKSKSGANAIAWAILALLLVILVLTAVPEAKDTAIQVIGAATANP